MSTAEEREKCGCKLLRIDPFRDHLSEALRFHHQRGLFLAFVLSEA